MKYSVKTASLAALISTISIFLAFPLAAASDRSTSFESEELKLIAKVKKPAKNLARTRTLLPAKQINHFGLAANTGFSFFGMGYGIEGWYLPRKTMHTGIQFFVAKNTINGIDVGTPKIQEVMKIETSMASAFVRYSFLYGLYVKGALRFAASKGQYGFVSSDEETKDRFRDLTADTTLLSLSLGSHTTFRTGHHFGIDWIGLGVPLTKKISLKTETPEPDTSPVDDISQFFTGDSSRNRSRNMFNDQLKFYYLLLRAGFEF